MQPLQQRVDLAGGQQQFQRRVVPGQRRFRHAEQHARGAGTQHRTDRDRGLCDIAHVVRHADAPHHRMAQAMPAQVGRVVEHPQRRAADAHGKMRGAGRQHMLARVRPHGRRRRRGIVRPHRRHQAAQCGNGRPMHGSHGPMLRLPLPCR
nr:hypothetical protein [Xanthomonas sacchari]